jgi:hypothetical protein
MKTELSLAERIFLASYNLVSLECGRITLTEEELVMALNSCENLVKESAENHYKEMLAELNEQGHTLPSFSSFRIWGY